MDKQTLSHYGWIVIVVLVLAVMLAFATPFGTYVGDAVVATTKGFGSITENNLNEDNIKNQGDKWEDKFENGVGGGTSEPESPTQPEEPEEPEEPVYVGTGLLLPEGSIYTMKDKEMCNELYNGKSVFYGGERLPKDYKYTYNDTYEDGEYKYTYTFTLDQNYDRVPVWNPKVLDTTKESYSEIPTTILGEPIVQLNGTFKDCTNMKYAPKIPSGIYSLNSVFFNCTSLIEAPTIPDGVDSTYNTFGGCTALTTPPRIPDSVRDMGSMFKDCTSLIEAPTIPDGVDSTFRTFEGCTALTTPPRIPDSVTSIGYMFKDCTSLKSFPYPIPESVDNMMYTFEGCTSLTGTITINCREIHNTGTSALGTFNDTILPIKLKGSCSGLRYFTDSDSANNGNVTLA